MRFIQRQDVVRASFVLVLLPLLAAINGCGGDIPIGSDAAGVCGTAEGGGAPEGTALLVVLDDVTPDDKPDWMGLLQNDVLTVLDPANPNTPLLELSGLREGGVIGAWRTVATSKSKKRLAVTELYDQPKLRVFDENLQPLVNVTLPNTVAGVYPTEQAIFALTNGTMVKYDSNGSYVGSANGPLGIDLVVDEDRQVVWTVGKYLSRTTTDLANEERFHTFDWYGVSLDLDANGGVWVAERRNASAGGGNRLVHFDINGNIISGDTLMLPGSPLSVRVDRCGGRVWVAMGDVWVAMAQVNGGVAYRDVNGQLNTLPGLTGSWFAVEPDPLDGSRAWAASLTTGQVIHVDTNGTIIQSLESFGQGQKWLAMMLRGP